MSSTRLKNARAIVHGARHSAVQRSAGPALGVLLRNRATTADDDSDDEPLHGPIECPKCKKLNLENSKFCNKCGKKLSDADACSRAKLERKQARVSRALLMLADGTDKLTQQVEALKGRSTGGVDLSGVDLSIFSARERIAYGLERPNLSVVECNGETHLGLLSPEQAQEILSALGARQ